ncbi:hypothetical protein [Methylobacterium isbiliense]|uniref:Uncharacterized protein n=1 Tax=Methylobacterium isbiliense TaxID=315478 RepID=A0ABQ4SEF9_9HYPH|nr:hypothetical protein [Methylobacterium isbiliense]MDN3622568.1 hypothetical protein [Methylobacterium isbiliense]GJE01447.1 hypothetical protein GMJLKIPL_3378 [Methylobacterium isbiliense]
MRTFPSHRTADGLLVVPVDFTALRRARRREQVSFWAAFVAALSVALSFLGGAYGLATGIL